MPNQLDELDVAKARELLARRHELLVAQFLGAICEHGESEVLAALQQATADYYEWKRQNAPNHVPMWLRLQQMANLRTT